MIPVPLRNPPAGFMAKVAAPGRKWLKDHGIALNAKVPQGIRLPAYWTRCLDDLHVAYGGVCAYLSVYIERGVGAASTDHFVAKTSGLAKDAYAWKNYRLACLAMNRKKSVFDDVLDPATLAPGLFRLELLKARVRIDMAVAPQGSPLWQDAVNTLDRLQLNQTVYCTMRLRLIDRYLARKRAGSAAERTQALQELALASPFVHAEMVRQGWS